MSKQEQFEMLRMELPAQYAARLLLRDVKPILDGSGLEVPTQEEVQFVRDYGIVKRATMTDAQLLGALLTWITSNPALVRIPEEIVAQAALLAARVFDYPQVIVEAKRQAQSVARKGKGNNYDPLNPDARASAIAAALRRRGSEDRDIVVGDLAATLGIGASQARRILAQHGWPGRDKHTG